MGHDSLLRVTFIHFSFSFSNSSCCRIPPGNLAIPSQSQSTVRSHNSHPKGRRGGGVSGTDVCVAVAHQSAGDIGCSSLVTQVMGNGFVRYAMYLCIYIYISL